MITSYKQLLTSISNLDPDTIAIYGELIVITVMMIIIMYLLKSNVMMKEALKPRAPQSTLTAPSFDTDNEELSRWLLVVWTRLRQGVQRPNYTINTYNLKELGEGKDKLKRELVNVSPCYQTLGDALTVLVGSFFQINQLVTVDVITAPLLNGSVSSTECDAMSLVSWVCAHREQAITTLRLTEKEWFTIQNGMV